MITYKGVHTCTFSVADDEGKASCTIQCAQDIELVFDDCVVMLPEMIMHYLDPLAATMHFGWEAPWLPPQWFIDKVMTADQIQLHPTRRDYACKQVIKLGYLTHLGALKELEKYEDLEGDPDLIIDTQGGDVEYNPDDTVIAQFGDSPVEFLNRMHTLVHRATLESIYNKDYSGSGAALCSAYEYPAIVEFTEEKYDPSDISLVSFPITPLSLMHRIMSSAEYNAVYTATFASGGDQEQLLQFTSCYLMANMSWTTSNDEVFSAVVSPREFPILTAMRLKSLSLEDITEALCQLFVDMGVASVQADNSILETDGVVTLIIDRKDALSLKGWQADVEIDPLPGEQGVVEDAAAVIENYFLLPEIPPNPFYQHEVQRDTSVIEEKYSTCSASMFAPGRYLVKKKDSDHGRSSGIVGTP